MEIFPTFALTPYKKEVLGLTVKSFFGHFFLIYKLGKYGVIRKSWYPTVLKTWVRVIEVSVIHFCPQLSGKIIFTKMISSQIQF